MKPPVVLVVPTLPVSGCPTTPVTLLTVLPILLPGRLLPGAPVGLP